MRRLLANLALSATAGLFALLLAEAALRAIGYAPTTFRHTERVANGRRTLLLDCYPTNPRGYFDIDLRDTDTRRRYREQGLLRVDEVVDFTPFAVERRYDSRRFRGPEIPPKRPATTRIVVIGDSFTEGMGVREEDAYPRVLESVLKADRDAERSWEVLNCGRRGWDFPAIHDTFDEVMEHEPDIVVFGMVLNDAEQSQAFAARQARLNDWILDRSRMFREERPGPGLLDSRLVSLLRDRVDRYQVARDTSRWYRDMYGEPNREGWERTQAHLRRMNSGMRQRGGHLVVALWPLLVGLESDYPFADVSEAIEDFCLTEGIPFHDLLPALRGRPSASLWVHPVDHHPNEVAHRLAAQSLVPTIRSLAGENP